MGKLIKKKKIVFVTGTRADYGKLKSIIKIMQNSKKFNPIIYITGMHNLRLYGSTYMEIEKDKIKRGDHLSNCFFLQTFSKCFSA